MTTLVDTSELDALLDADDDNHTAAVEAAALVHHRLGAAAVRDLFDALLPALTIVFVDGALHARASAGYLGGLGRRVSFVDRVSFQVVREMAIDRACAFDRDFVTEGFVVVP